MFLNRTAFVLATAWAVLAASSLAFAAPFNSKDVAVDPAMIMHFDCDVIRTSALGKSILSQPQVQDKLASAGAFLDMDLLTQLHGVTVYTTVAHVKENVMLVNADFDAERLLAKAQALNDFQATTNSTRVIYSWLDEKWKRREGGTARVYGAISGHHAILGRSESAVMDASDVVEGKTRSFGGGKELPRANPGEAILLQGALFKVDANNAQGPAAIFAMSKSTSLKVSEANKNITAALRFEAGDDNTVGQVNSIAQGLLGMLKMTADNTNALKLANSIAISQDKLAVGVTFSMPSSEVVEMMKEGQEKREQRRSNRRARDEDSKPNNR